MRKRRQELKKQWRWARKDGGDREAARRFTLPLGRLHGVSHRAITSKWLESRLPMESQTTKRNHGVLWIPRKSFSFPCDTVFLR